MPCFTGIINAISEQLTAHFHIPFVMVNKSTLRLEAIICIHPLMMIFTEKATYKLMEKWNHLWYNTKMWFLPMNWITKIR
jgi:hypothetical protein